MFNTIHSLFQMYVMKSPGLTDPPSIKVNIQFRDPTLGVTESKTNVINSLLILFCFTVFQLNYLINIWRATQSDHHRLVLSFISALEDGQSKAGTKSLNLLIAKIKEIISIGTINQKSNKRNKL